MKKIVIIGGGFAGLWTADGLRRRRCPAELVLIDQRETADFLPVLPDLIGQRLAPPAARAPLETWCARRGIRFVRDRVVRVDARKNSVAGDNASYAYDILVIASGSEPNFFGNRAAEERAGRLDNVATTIDVCLAADAEPDRPAVVVGGGYTGLEIATNFRRRAQRAGVRRRIMIVEMADRMLGPLPEWMRRYARENLQRMAIDVKTGCVLESMDEGGVRLSDGTALEEAQVVWSAGVHTSAFVRAMDVDQDRQGRLRVDRSLRLDESLYVLGDAAHVEVDGKPLRMAVQFSIAQGALTARNIMRSLDGRPPVPFKPLDLGFVLPMANLRSCGYVLNVNVRGLPASMLHYMMCIYRSIGWRQKQRMVGNLLGARADDRREANDEGAAA